MPKQFLDRPYVGSSLEGVGGKTVAESVAANSFGDSHSAGRGFDCFVHRGFVEMVPPCLPGTGIDREAPRRKDILPGPFPARTRILSVQGSGQIDRSLTSFEVFLIQRSVRIE